MKSWFVSAPVEEQLRVELREPQAFCALRRGEKALRLLVQLPTALLLMLAVLTICRELGSLHLIYTPLTAAAVLVLALLVEKLRGASRWWLLVLTAAAAGARAVFALGWTVHPHEIYLTDWNLALELAAAGSAEWPALVEAAGYTGSLTTELPHVLYMTVLLRLFGPAPAAVQLPGALWGGLSCLLTALIGEKLSGSRKAGLLAGALLGCCPTLLFSAGVLSWQPLYTLLLLAGVWLLICRPFGCPGLNAVLAGLLWGVAQVLRPGLPVPLLAALVWWLLTLPGRAGRKASAARVGCLLAALLAAVLALGLTECQFTGVNVLDGHLAERLTVGLNEETAGQYDENDRYDPADEAPAVGETVAQALQNPSGTLRLLLRKVRFQFASYDYEWARLDRGIDLRNRIMDELMQPVLQSYMAVVLLLALAGALAALRRQSRAGLLLPVMLLGYLAAAVLLEVDPVYNACVIPLLAVFAAAPGLKLAEWTALVLAPDGSKAVKELPAGLRAVRLLVSIVLYVLMLALVLIFFTGEGVFIYEAF